MAYFKLWSKFFQTEKEKSLQLVFALTVSPGTWFFHFSHSAFVCPFTVVVPSSGKPAVVNHINQLHCTGVTEDGDLIPNYTPLLSPVVGHTAVTHRNGTRENSLLCLMSFCLMNPVLVQNLLCHNFPYLFSCLSETLLRHGRTVVNHPQWRGETFHYSADSLFFISHSA